MPIDEIWKIGQFFTDEYNEMLEFAIKNLNAQRFNDFDFMDFADKKNQFLTEIEFFKKQGRLN